MTKLVFICIGLSVSLAREAAADQQRRLLMGRPRPVLGVPSGTHPLVYRSAADRYAVVGEGVLRTRNCTVTAPGITARVSVPDSRGRRWVTFVDPVLGYEGQCMVDDGPAPAPTASERSIILRGIATTEGR